ncbi:MAG: hypothetical protein RIC55_36915 [Pirellulaceae bacterium]
MFKCLPRVLAVLVVLAASAVPISAQAAEGGQQLSASSWHPHALYEYELWVREEGTRRWWLWNTYDEYGNAEFIAYYFEAYGYDTYILRVSIFDSQNQLTYPWD